MLDPADGAARSLGVTGLTEAAALGYAGAGIRVNGVCPGVVETPMPARHPALENQVVALVLNGGMIA